MSDADADDAAVSDADADANADDAVSDDDDAVRTTA